MHCCCKVEKPEGAGQIEMVKPVVEVIGNRYCNDGIYYSRREKEKRIIHECEDLERIYILRQIPSSGITVQSAVRGGPPRLGVESKRANTESQHPFDAQH